MGRLRVTSLQAENADELYRAVADYIGRRGGLEVEFVYPASWRERLELLERGEVDVASICGWPYTFRVDAGEPIELLAAPVFAAPRYQDRPVYFSDVVVRRESPARSFADLRGATWAYNEPHSHSGYNLTLSHLASLGETEGYFGHAVEAGAHQASLELLVRGEVDASAVDSYVLEVELRRRPELGEALRVVETLGPSPSPPLIVRREVPERLVEAARGALLSMHEDGDGRAILEGALVSRFARVTDEDYDPIRRMAERAASGRLSLARTS